ncbi:MAG TPA: hypothetical protein VGI40_10695 [Pirellulaceae bacterium]
MAKNPILDELHAVRQRLLEESGGTLDALVDRLQAEEERSDRPRFQPSRTNGSTGAVGQADSENKASSPQLG